MAQDLQTILGKTINSTKELKNEINALRDSLINVDSSSDEWQSTAEKLTAAQERLTSITQAGKTSMDAAEDSIVGLEKQYKALYNTYKLLSEEQRNSDFGKQMATSLEGLSSKLNDTKKDVGNFKDNIGRYTSSAMDAFNTLGISVGGLQKPMQLATVGANGLGAAFKSLIANPVGAIIMAVVVAFQAMKSVVDNVRDAINNNEESQMALSVAMSAFQPVLDKISNMWDYLGQVVVKVIGWFGDAFRKAREIRATITDFLNITDGARERVEEENKLYKDLAETQNRITKEKREQSILNEEDRARIEELKNEAAATTNQAEKLKKLTEAKQLLEKVTDRSVKLAEDELRLMKERAKLTANSAEDNDKIAAKQAEINRLKREANTQDKEMTGQVTSLTTALKSNTKATTDNTDANETLNQKRQAVLDELKDYGKKESQILEEEYQEKLKLIKDGEKLLTDAELKLIDKYNKLIDEAKQKERDKAKADRQAELAKPLDFIEGNIRQGEIETATRISGYYADADTDPRSTADAEAFRNAENHYINWLNTKAQMLETELGMEFDTLERRKEVEAEYWAVKEELRNRDYENQLRIQELEEASKDKTEESIASFVSVNDAIGTLSSTISGLMKAEIQEGKLSEKELEKKKRNLKNLEKIQLAVAVAAVAADTAAGIMSVWRGYGAEKVVNAQTAAAAGAMAAPVMAALEAKSLANAILQTTGIAIAGSAQLAAAAGGYVSNVKAINDIGGGAEAAGVSSPVMIDSSSYSYTRQLQTEDEEQALNRPIIVQVSDIEDALQLSKERNAEVTF